MHERCCPQCGADLKGRRANAKFCGALCRRRWQDNNGEPCAHPGCSRGVRSNGLCNTHYNQTKPNRHRRTESRCVVCGATVTRRVDTARDKSRCCSVECRTVRQFGRSVTSGQYTWAVDAIRRARAAGALVVELVDRDAVLARDQWRCYCCNIDLTATDNPFDPASATVDHVIPLAAGGEHSMRNVRACCLGCNSSKGRRHEVGARPTLITAH